MTDKNHETEQEHEIRELAVPKPDGFSFGATQPTIKQPGKSRPRLPKK